jgi:hypothetical protein
MISCKNTSSPKRPILRNGAKTHSDERSGVRRVGLRVVSGTRLICARSEIICGPRIGANAHELIALYLRRGNDSYSFHGRQQVRVVHFVRAHSRTSRQRAALQPRRHRAQVRFQPVRKKIEAGILV